MVEDPNYLNQADNPMVAIAVLREQNQQFGREMRDVREALREQRDEMRKSQEALNKKIEEVLTVMAEARGGWRTLVLLGGMSASLGAGLSWVVQHLPKWS